MFTISPAIPKESKDTITDIDTICKGKAIWILQ